MSSSPSSSARRRARIRCLLIPGAGLATLGYPGWAVTAGLPLVCAFASLAAVALVPCGVAFWAFAVSVALAVVSAIAEYVAVGRVEPKGDGDHGVRTSRLRFRLVALLYLLAVGATGWAVVRHVGWFVVREDGMAPTLRSGQWILFSRFSPQANLARGRVAAFKLSLETAAGAPGELTIGRIIAGPGDEIAIDGRHYRVNGRQSAAVSPLGTARPALRVPNTPGKLTVPHDCYFVVQDDAAVSADSRMFSWVRRRNVISTRMILVSQPGWGTTVR